MEMTRQMQVGILLSTIAMSGLAAAECPQTMPYQLLQDCITYEGAGSQFPAGDYAYMDLYQDWLEKQGQQAATGKPVTEDSASPALAAIPATATVP